MNNSTNKTSYSSTPKSPNSSISPKGKKPAGKKLNPIKIILSLIGLIILGGAITTVYLLYFRSFQITPSTINVKSEGTEAHIEVKGAKDWNVRSSVPSWIDFAQVGNMLICSVSENDSHKRTAKIEIGNSHHSCYLTINQESGLFSGNPSNVIVSANPSEPAKFLIEGQDDWKISEGPEGWGKAYREDNYLRWKVDENYGEERDDYVVLQSGNKALILTLKQEGALSSEKMSVTVGSGENTTRIKISGPTEWYCSSNEYWCHAQREGNKLRLDFDKNEDTSAREGYITVSGGNQKITLDIKQNGKTTYYTPVPPYPNPYWWQ